jgi:hypothetical protein
LKNLPVLLPYQQEWLFADGYDFYLLCKSRRIGGTFLTALRCVLRALKGRNQYYSSYREAASKNFIKYCVKWLKVISQIRVSQGKQPIVFEAQIFIIRIFEGAEIEGIPSNEVNLRDREGDLVIDEAAYRDLESLLDAGSAITMWGGVIDIISSQSWEYTYFNFLLNEIKECRRPGYVQEIPFRQAVDEGFYKKVCERRSIPWSEQGEKEYINRIYATVGIASKWELDCIPRTGEGNLIDISEVKFASDLESIPCQSGLGFIPYRSWDLAGTDEDVANAGSYYTANVLVYFDGVNLIVADGDARRNSPIKNHVWFEEISLRDRGVIQLIEGEPADHSAGYIEILKTTCFKNSIVEVIKPYKNKIARALPMLEGIKKGEVIFLEDARHIALEILKLDPTKAIPKVQDYTDALSNLYGKLKKESNETMLG